jgi:pimeloyl-ACP methyl ester carboxylesterase
LARPQGHQTDRMRGASVDDRGDGIMTDDIDAAAQQGKTLCGEVGHLGRFRQARREPRLDRMTVGGSDIEVTDGRVWLKRSGIGCFCGDLPEAEQKLVYATQGAPVADLFNQKVEGTAWKAKPSWYIVGTQDRTVNPELQRFAAKRMKAATTEVTSSHVPMLSKPDAALDVIR